MTAPNLLPEDVQCPNCGVELKLSEEERTRRQFTCSVCRESFTVALDAKYCPECGAEFRPKMTECADCKVPLSDTFVGETPKPAPDQYLEVMSTYNIADLAVIKGLFEGEKIEYYLQGENFHAVMSWVQPVKIFVREDHVDMAKELLFGLNLHATAAGSLTTKLEEEDDDASL